MVGQHPGQVVCFSYLASASLWNIESFPLANHGAESSGPKPRIAADGPMVAAVRIIQDARLADLPLLVNLGGSALSLTVASVVRDRPGLIIQTSVDGTVALAKSTTAATTRA